MRHGISSGNYKMDPIGIFLRIQMSIISEILLRISFGVSSRTAFCEGGFIQKRCQGIHGYSFSRVTGEISYGSSSSGTK